VSLQAVTYAIRPDLRRREDVDALADVWPEFLLHDATVNEHYGRVRDGHPEFQVLLLDGDVAIAEGSTIPVRWDGVPEPRGVDWALDTGSLAGTPTTLCALEAKISPDYRGRGLSRVLVEHMLGLAREHGLDALIAPVRPTLKHLYPLIPIDRYITWRREDGQLFDPWLRTHERLGAELLAPCPESMRIEGDVPTWEEWTGLVFPEDGAYVVERALVPVVFECGHGLYLEPNVWMRHPVS
jgi:GNAT superfamily N-acetyltransferase